MCVGAGIGWVEGFPRWSYAYVGYGLLFVLYMTSVSTPGLRVLGHTFARGEHWGWRAWLPMAVVLLLGLAATRSLRPAVQLVTGAWRDPTRLSFLLYGATPLVLWMLFDEVHKPFPAPFLAVSGLCLAAGAVAYIRGRTQVQHALALLAGLAAAWLVTTVGVSAYWHGRVVGKATEPLRWSSNAVPMTIALVVVALLMLAPALVLALVRLGARPKRTA